MFFDEFTRMAAGFIIDDVSDVALLPKLDGLGFVGGGVGKEAA